jgi:adenylate kinase family enzyme
MHRRIIITGVPGSGKSTLAERLANSLGAPFVELDALYWEPGWVEADADVFRARVRAVTDGDAWVLAGNYFSRTQDITWPRAQCAVFLDVPLVIALARIAHRSWKRSRSQELLWGTNIEPPLRAQLTNWQDSLFVWAMRSQPKLRKRWQELMCDARFEQVDFVHLRSSRAVERWLSEQFGTLHSRS